MLAALTFLSPLGALAALAAVIPVAAALAAARASARAARVLRLEPQPLRRAVAPAAVAALAVVLVGVAAARPAWRSTPSQPVRTHSEVLYVVDVSRSMAAAPSLSAPTRLAHARGVVRAIHAAVADVPSGLAGMTDRVLPYLFPTADGSVFDATLRSSVAIEAPPPQEVATNATSFASLEDVASGGFFDPSARTRTCVLVTDGESRSYDVAGVASALAGPQGCRLVVVRVGSTADRVYGPDGTPEAGYAPSAAAADRVRALASATSGRSFDASATGAAAAAVRADAEQGPVGPSVAHETLRPLALWLALAALVLTLAYVVSRLGNFAMQRPVSEE